MGLGGSSSTESRLNWNLEMLAFEERGKPEDPEKNLLEQGQEPTTNSTHMMPSTGIEPRSHRWEASALTTAPSLLPHEYKHSHYFICTYANSA